ncbi:uncharacterized protein LOC119333759 [Triticum dicoccoides]|uniref:uncharacterized protein LOC119333759 n=1 Tax=Triticum dicoccoides TaxID=85692 RepID=UPI00189130A4|nr:uncharacterized protein LOC119333759 [Triticum dicoccoides]
MRRLSSTSRPLLSFMASAPPRHSWSPPALARRALPLMEAPSLAAPRIYGLFPHGSRGMASTSGFKGDDSAKPDARSLISSTKDRSAISQGMETAETSGTTLEVTYPIAGTHDAFAKTVDISGCEENGRSSTNKDTKRASVASDGQEDDVDVLPIGMFPKSTHRDRSIYRANHSWKREYNVANRNETRLPEPTDCDIRNGKCIRHIPNRVLQILSLKLTKLTVDPGPVELYRYIAVRDYMDTLLNYVVNISRDDPIIVKQGSLIAMAGPKRGINMLSTALVEFDMRIKVGKEERHDCQLIDGVSDLDDLWSPWDCALKYHINGDCGTVDLTVSRIDHAVMANVEVDVSEVRSSFDLCFRCFIGGYDEEIRLFNGTIGESRHLTRSVVAVVDGSTLDLKFEVASEPSGSAEHCCSFKAGTHGLDTREMKTEFGLISVKVTWSTLLSI